MQNQAVCGDIIWRSDSNEPPGPAWPFIFRKCPVALKRLIVQANNFVELENTMGSPKKTKKIVLVDFHVISPLIPSQSWAIYANYLSLYLAA